MLGRKGAEVAAQKLVDSGDAATLKEAYSLQARIGARAAAQKRSVESDAEVTVKAEATQATQSSASRVRIPKKPRREPKAEPL